MEEDNSSVELVYEGNFELVKVKEEVDPIQNADGGDEGESVLMEGPLDNEEAVNHCKDGIDLLEPLNPHSTEDDDEDEGEKINKSINKDGLESMVGCESDDQKLRELMGKYKWCFKDSENMQSAWCLYCNVALKGTTSNGLSKHANSLKHQERTEEYLAYLNQLDSDKCRLYSNHDYGGDVNEAKSHRKSLEEGFSNFLWDKWEEEHDWLLRTDQCFFAYCKYCHLKIAVSNKRARKLHEDSVKHKEFKGKAPKRRATVCGELQNFQLENLTLDQEVNKEDESAIDDINMSEFTDKWYEKSKSSSDLCRCKLCDITMFRASYVRHTNSNLHRQNLFALGTPGVSDKLVKPDWAAIQKDHEWIMEDPIDGMEGYCKYCEKRLGYASSAAKRLIHEHSASHRAAVHNFHDSGSKTRSLDEMIVDQVEKEDYEQDKDGEREDKNEESDSNAETVQRRKRRRNRKDKIAQFPWAKPYKKDSRYFICQYCKVLLRKECFSGRKHAISARHQQLEKQYLDKCASKTSFKSLSETPVRVRGTFYPWLVKFQDGVNFVYCRYCNFRFSRRASRAHHQKTQRHVNAEKAILENLADGKKSGTLVKSLQTPNAHGGEMQSPLVTKSNVKEMKTKFLEWQKRFSWLRYENGLQLNYGFCTYCERSVFLPSPGYATKHQRTTPHKRARNELWRRERTQSGKNTKSIESEEMTTQISWNDSSGLSSKRFKPSSLKNAIETAKRLTAAHLDMLKFVENSAQKPTDLIRMVKMTSVKSVPPPPPSPSVDSNVGTPNSRDPFDLFFNSMSETLKRLPSDLASEGKLKVMQIIFDLEIRAQQRLNTTGPTNTSSSSHNTSVLNTSNDKASVDDSPEIAKTLNNIQSQQLKPQEQLIQHHQQQPSQSQQQLQQQMIYEERQQNHHPNTPSSVNLKQNSILQQQLSRPQRPITQQPQMFVMHNQSNSTQRNRHVTTSQFMPTYKPQGQRSPMLKSSPNLGKPINESSHRSEYFQNQHIASSNIYLNNFNQRSTANNPSITHNASNTPIKSPNRNHPNNYGIYFNDSGNNKVQSPKKVSSIRPVPLSSLTVTKCMGSKEPPIHHIQLNSSTQSKIIPLDTNKGIQK